MKLGYVGIIVSTEPCIVVMPYLLSAKKSAVMQVMFKSIGFDDSD